MAKWRVAVWAAVVIAAFAFLYLVRGILFPFVLAGLIAVILDPIVRRLQKTGLSRIGSIATITAVFFLIVGGFCIYFIPRVSQQLGELQSSIQTMTNTIAVENRSENHFLRWNPALRAQPPGPLANVDKALDQAAPLLEKAGLPTTRRAILDQYIAPQRDQIAKAITDFFNGFFKILLGAASQVFMLIFLPLFVFYILAEMDKLQSTVAGYIPPSIRKGTISMLSDIADVFQGYLRGLLTNVAMFTGVMALLFAALGVPYWILLAILAGALYLIPVIGGFISAPTLLLVVGFSGAKPYWMPNMGSSWTFGIIAMVVFVTISTAYDMVITPRTVGKSVGLHPLVSMFVVFSGGALFGLPGMIIAYPLAGSVKVILARMMKVTNQTSPDELIQLPAIPLRHRELTES